MSAEREYDVIVRVTGRGVAVGCGASVVEGADGTSAQAVSSVQAESVATRTSRAFILQASL